MIGAHVLRPDDPPNDSAIGVDDLKLLFGPHSTDGCHRAGEVAMEVVTAGAFSRRPVTATMWKRCGTARPPPKAKPAVLPGSERGGHAADHGGLDDDLRGDDPP